MGIIVPMFNFIFKVQKLTLTLLTHKSPNYTIMSIGINHFLYKLNHFKGQFEVKLADFYFFALGTNGLRITVNCKQHDSLYNLLMT